MIASSAYLQSWGDQYPLGVPNHSGPSPYDIWTMCFAEHPLEGRSAGLRELGTWFHFSCFVYCLISRNRFLTKGIHCLLRQIQAKIVAEAFQNNDSKCDGNIVSHFYIEWWSLVSINAARSSRREIRKTAALTSITKQ